MKKAKIIHLETDDLQTLNIYASWLNISTKKLIENIIHEAACITKTSKLYEQGFYQKPQ